MIELWFMWKQKSWFNGNDNQQQWLFFTIKLTAHLNKCSSSSIRRQLFNTVISRFILIWTSLMPSSYIVLLSASETFSLVRRGIWMQIECNILTVIFSRSFAGTLLPLYWIPTGSLPPGGWTSAVYLPGGGPLHLPPRCSDNAAR